MVDDEWWLSEVRPEWVGHTWRALEASTPAKLLDEARVWADSPAGVLYVHAASIRRAYGFAVAVSQRASKALIGDDPRRRGEPLAVGLFDELSVPEDPDPEFTKRTRDEHPLYSAEDTRNHHYYQYMRRLQEARLTLLRLSPVGDPEGVLDGVADHRKSWDLPTLIASVVPPSQVTAVYGGRIGWRLGFAESDGSPIGLSTPDAAVLDLERPPR